MKAFNSSRNLGLDYCVSVCVCDIIYKGCEGTWLQLKEDVRQTQEKLALESTKKAGKKRVVTNLRYLVIFLPKFKRKSYKMFPFCLFMLLTLSNGEEVSFRLFSFLELLCFVEFAQGFSEKLFYSVLFIIKIDCIQVE